MESYINKETHKKDIDYKNEESTLNPNTKVAPLNFQIMSKLSFNKYIDINNKRYKIRIKSVHELPNNRIGILTRFNLLIYSLNTFKLIKKLEPDLKLIFFEDKKIGKSTLIDFLVLKNNDLVIWNSVIIFFYNLKSKEYKLYQTINEYNPKIDKEKFGKYEGIYIYVKSIYELLNGNLVTYNSVGLKIYYKKNNEYYLNSKLIFNFVEKIVEIWPNVLILFQREYLGRKCLDTLGANIFENSISIYYIEIGKKRKLQIYKEYDFLSYDEGNINFLIKNNYLLTRYQNNFDIFYIDKDGEWLNKSEIENDYYVYSRPNKKIEKKWKSYFLCDYYDDLFFVENENKLKIYSFRDKKISFFRDFPFNLKQFKGIFELKNNLLVMYSEKEIKIIKAFY